ncbi:MAG: hypothetical protein MSIBF_01465 [Candidatus Altiarchaeales archaeon IMC4]|nr:MAG: hypothetical protein MSIBF_01465 [Candidatus Altiarchaeales archaeon IMC4]
MKCKCGKPAPVELEYRGESMCAMCFNEMFEKRVRKTIRTNRLLRHDDRIAVAVSGGKKSAVLLYLLKNVNLMFPMQGLFAITVYEGDMEGLKYAKNLCRKLDVKHYVIPGSAGGVSETLDTESEKLNATKIAVGHDLDEGVVSAIGRLVSVGMKPAIRTSPPIIINPLRDCSDEEVLRFAMINEIVFAKSALKDSLHAAIKNLINEIEQRHHGAKFQMSKSAGELKNLLNQTFQDSFG